MEHGTDKASPRIDGRLSLRGIMIAGFILMMVVGLFMFCWGYQALEFQYAGGSKADHVRTQIVSIQEGLEAYKKDIGYYPSIVEGLRALQRKPDSIPDDKWRGPYIHSDPDLIMDAYYSGKPLAYRKTVRPESYYLASAGPDGVFDTQDDITNFTKVKAAINPRRMVCVGLGMIFTSGIGLYILSIVVRLSRGSVLGKKE